MSRPISLAHLTVLDATPPELISVAAAAGFRTVGIRLTATPSVGVPPYDILSEGPVLRETLRRMADTGVNVLDTEFLRFEPDRPVGVPDGFLEVSARLGAKNVLVMSAEPEEARTIERFSELCDRAAQYGLQVGLEFAIYTGVRTLAHAASILAKAGRPNASILIDALHFSRSGGLPEHVKQVDPRLLRYAQICDASADMPGWRVVHPRWRNGGSCLSDMRRPVDFAQLHDEVGGIEEPLSPSRVIASDLSAPGSIISIAASRSA